MKLDALTRQWDVYAKEGSNDYTKVNPHNLQPVFTQDQLSTSLCALSLIALALHRSFLKDTDQLHKDICNAYPSDPITATQFPEPYNSKWTISDGLLYLNNQIYVPDIPDLQLQVLQNKHNHLIPGHFG